MTMNPAPNQNQNQNQNTLSIIAIVLGAISFVSFWFFGLITSIVFALFVSIIFGASAIVLAILAKKKLEKLSKVAFVIAIAGTAISPVIVLGLILLRTILGSII